MNAEERLIYEHNLLKILMVTLRTLCIKDEEEAQDVLENALGSDSALKAWARAVGVTRKHFDNTPVFGVIALGTGEICDLAGIPVPDRVRAIAQLKSTNRILQCGRGKGKAVILVNDLDIDKAELDYDNNTVTVLELNVGTTTTPDTNWNALQVIPVKNDTKGVTEEVVDNVKETFSRVELEVEVARATADLQKALEDKDRQIQELKNKNNTKYITTWT